MKYALLAATLCFTPVSALPTSFPDARFDVQTHQKSERAKMLALEATVCAFEATRDYIARFGTATLIPLFIMDVCGVLVAATLDAENIAPAARKLVIKRWLYSVMKDGLASFNQGLTADWPEELPEDAPIPQAADKTFPFVLCGASNCVIPENSKFKLYGLPQPVK